MQNDPFLQNPVPLSEMPRTSDSVGDARFSHSRYAIKKKWLQLLGASFYLYDPSENIVLFGAQKAFKLKEDFRLYADENKQSELLRMAARSIMDFSAAYDVYDSQTEQKIGAFKRQGLKSSFVQDTWVLMDVNDNVIGQAQEDSALLGLIRRFVDWAAFLLPQKYHVTLDSAQIATFTQTKNPFSSKMDIEFGAVPQNYDRRLVLCLAMLLSAVEGKQR